MLVADELPKSNIVPTIETASPPNRSRFDPIAEAREHISAGGEPGFDDLSLGACGAAIEPHVGRALATEIVGFDDDDDDSSDDNASSSDDDDELDDFDEIDEEDFDDDFDDDFEEELEDEYEIEIEDEISAEFGLGPDRDDDEELDDLESLADDLEDLDDNDDLKDL